MERKASFRAAQVYPSHLSVHPLNLITNRRANRLSYECSDTQLHRSQHLASSNG